VAKGNGVDVDFFARLIWKESLFDAAAISPAGAQGIAQFMPGTAKLRGLRDAFNPAAALAASAEYLAELSRNYGNLGLAAAAYNGGEARIERYIAAGGGLPAETRAYVHAITGHSVEVWRDAPPTALDLALDKGAPFQTHVSRSRRTAVCVNSDRHRRSCPGGSSLLRTETGQGPSGRSAVSRTAMPGSWGASRSIIPVAGGPECRGHCISPRSAGPAAPMPKPSAAASGRTGPIAWSCATRWAA
jgi:hypothetical protein